MRRFEYVKGSSNKFWSVDVRGGDVTVAYGAIGSDGRTQTKPFATAAEADKHAAKLIASKVKKGYVEVGAAPAPDASIEPVLAALLAVMKASPAVEGQQLLSSLSGTLPAGVKAFVETATTHVWSADLEVGTRGFDLDLETLADHGFKEEIEAALVAAGKPPQCVLSLGSSGGGEVFLLLTWDAAGLALVTYDYEYAQLDVVGSFKDFAEHLYELESEAEEEPDRSDALQAMFVAAGLVEALAPPEPEEPAWRAVEPWSGPPQWPPLEVTEAETALLDSDSGTLNRVRTSDGRLIGFNAPSVVVISQDHHVSMRGSAAQISLAPSGKSFVIVRSRGHSVEYPLDGETEPTILDDSGSSVYRWAFDYYQDDQAVTVIDDPDDKRWMLLLKRNDSGGFDEIDNLRVSGTGNVATTGAFIVHEGNDKCTVYTTVSGRLVKLGVVKMPMGGAKPFPAETREELRVRGVRGAFRLENLHSLLPGKPPKPRPKGARMLQRRAAGAPSGAMDRGAFVAGLKGVFEHVPTDVRQQFSTASGYHGGYHKQDKLLVRPDGAASRVENPGQVYRVAHPTDDRAIVWDVERKMSVEEDLASGEQRDLVAGKASYCWVDGRELLLVLGSETAEVYARPDDPASPGALLGSYSYPKWGANLAGNSFLVTQKKSVRRVQVVADGAGVGFEVGPKLVPPGKRFDFTDKGGERVGGKDYLTVETSWFALD